MVEITGGWIAAVLAGVVVTVLLGAALVLTVAAMRRLSTALLMTAGAAVVAALVVAVVAHVEAPAPIGVPLALVGIAAAVVGGDPVTRRVLAIAASGRVRETPDGGIVVTDDAGAGASEEVVLLRGGATIGYLERIATAAAIIAGYPEAIAAVVAVKGVGRFSELSGSETRERFIVGTLSSLVWAAVVAAAVRLALF
ncbi:MAG: hypothetical protein CMH36_10325 [Microbacterium sp.]|uniref:Uncharacterized protein n=1 Tax=Microbacterium ginsengisoli TaxID=400772 RepID=A0A0F0LT23_9MICO|nr:hypothetical protein [Microbacterium ginsengisoli]KJL36387.1 hypothetical protein RR49_01719 [Microbacterium ginsengisoli]MAL07206.1 hypothetical protein [Microbacterium sp.]MBN9209090.1 hypothetical protein [Microbacterium ginsengisoli]HAN25855.1 hypothetical protein [Microbacterium ginsengisoli]